MPFYSVFTNCEGGTAYCWLARMFPGFSPLTWVVTRWITPLRAFQKQSQLHVILFILHRTCLLCENSTIVLLRIFLWWFHIYRLHVPAPNYIFGCRSSKWVPNVVCYLVYVSPFMLCSCIHDSSWLLKITEPNTKVWAFRRKLSQSSFWSWFIPQEF